MSKLTWIILVLVFIIVGCATYDSPHPKRPPYKQHNRFYKIN